ASGDISKLLTNLSRDPARPSQKLSSELTVPPLWACKNGNEQRSNKVVILVFMVVVLLLVISCNIKYFRMGFQYGTGPLEVSVRIFGTAEVHLQDHIIGLKRGTLYFGAYAEHGTKKGCRGIMGHPEFHDPVTGLYFMALCRIAQQFFLSQCPDLSIVSVPIGPDHPDCGEHTHLFPPILGGAVLFEEMQKGQVFIVMDHVFGASRFRGPCGIIALVRLEQVTGILLSLPGRDLGVQ